MYRLARQQRRAVSQLRRFAAQADVVAVENEAFTRFGSPYPVHQDLTSAVARLPESQVRAGIRVYGYEMACVC